MKFIMYFVMMILLTVLISFSLPAVFSKQDMSLRTQARSYYSVDSQGYEHSLKMKNGTVGVIIRSHEDYSDSLMSLLWALEAQYFDSNIVAVIVPTEFQSIKLLKEKLQKHWGNNVDTNRKVSLLFMDFSQDIYDSYCCVLQPLCTPEWYDRKLKENWSAQALERYCAVNSPLHYILTDKALAYLLSTCKLCQYVVVTNADNSYSPHFMEKTVNYIQSTNSDIVLTDMLHRDSYMPVEVENGKMDLGCALFGVQFLQKYSISFVSSLPSPTEPQHWHDADYWFVNKCVSKGAHVGIIRNVLFSHN